MGWAPGLVTTAGSLLNRVHLGWRGEGSGSLKGPRNGEGGPRGWGPSVSHLLRRTVKQEGNENNLQQLSKVGRGCGGERKPPHPRAACQGAGSEPRTGPHVGSDKGDGRLVFSATGWLQEGSFFCRNLSFLGLKGSPNPMPGRGVRRNTIPPPPKRRGQTNEGPRPSRPAANTRP